MPLSPRTVLLFSALAALFSLSPAARQPQTESPAPAGEIRALLPIAEILRGADAPRTAARNDPVFSRDMLRTGRGSRVRIILTDGSILSVGAESELRIVEHSPDAQQTELNLTYGRLRSTVQRITRPGAKHTIRTPTAVVGVVGSRPFVASLPDFSEIIALAGELLVRSANPSVTGDVRLGPGQFTRVYPGRPPLPAADASPEKIADAESSTDLPAATIDPEGRPTPITVSRAEVSWPPPECTAGSFVALRAWAKQIVEGREVESPLDPQSLNGRFQAGTDSFVVEAGQMLLPSRSIAAPAQAAFANVGATSTTPAAPTTVFPPRAFAPGDSWRMPRAVFAGSIFYVLAPPNSRGLPKISVADNPATNAWWGPCGIGAIAPTLPTPPGREPPLVTVSQNGKPVARGNVNIVQHSASATLRGDKSSGAATGANLTPVINRGQQADFIILITGLAGLQPPSPKDALVTVTVTNAAPAILGDLKSSTPGARVSGNTVTFQVTPKHIEPSGLCTLRLSGRGLQPGAYVLNFSADLAPNLDAPSFSLSLIPAPPSSP